MTLAEAKANAPTHPPTKSAEQVSGESLKAAHKVVEADGLLWHGMDSTVQNSIDCD